jgi:hypothetical protein
VAIEADIFLVLDFLLLLVAHAWLGFLVGETAYTAHLDTVFSPTRYNGHVRLSQNRSEVARSLRICQPQYLTVLHRRMVVDCTGHRRIRNRLAYRWRPHPFQGRS